VLPIGLSFHTFQSMSYTIEVYRGRQPVERNLWRFALYVMFFPQLVAGPIERPQSLLEQLKVEHHFDYDSVKAAIGAAQVSINRLPLLHSTFRRLVTFHLILMSWVFFRAASVTDALSALHAVFTNRAGRALTFESMGGRTVVVMAVASLVVCEVLQAKVGLRRFVSATPWAIRWPAYVAFVLMILLLGDFTSEQQFIYFQF